MILPQQLADLIPHQAQEGRAGLQDLPLRGEDEGGDAPLERLDQALLLTQQGLARLQLRLDFVIEHGTSCLSDDPGATPPTSIAPLYRPL
ncbi:hypothetical protein D3C84_1149570 [compost metagenome]